MTRVEIRFAWQPNDIEPWRDEKAVDELHELVGRVDPTDRPTTEGRGT